MTRIPNHSPIVVISKKSFNGRTWGNVWHFHVGGGLTADARVEYARVNISPVLAAFERGLLFDVVTLQDHYIGDTSEQRENSSILGDSFYTRVTYGQAGTQPSAGVDASTLADLNVAALIRLDVRNERPGHKFWKGWIGEGGISAGGPKGVTLTGASTLAAWNTALTSLLASNALDEHFEGGTGAADWVLATAHYTKFQGSTNRYVDHMSGVRSLAFVTVTPRKVYRRRTKRKAADEV